MEIKLGGCFISGEKSGVSHLSWACWHVCEIPKFCFAKCLQGYLSKKIRTGKSHFETPMLKFCKGEVNQKMIFSEMKVLKGDVRSNFYHIFFLSNLKLFFLTITKIYILSIFVFLISKYRALKFFYCCHGCKFCDVKIALFRKLRLRKKCLVKVVRVRIFHLIL